MIAEIIHPLGAGSARACLCGWCCSAYELAVISIVVQIGLALPMAEYFHRVSFSGFSSNLVVLAVDGRAGPGRDFWPSSPDGTGPRRLPVPDAADLARVVEWHARIEPNWRVADPPLWLAVAFVASLIVLALLIERKYLRWPSLACRACAVRAIDLAAVSRGTFKRHLLELTAIDVGQGDSLLVSFPTERTC